MNKLRRKQIDVAHLDRKARLYAELFDELWYAQRYPDVAISGVAPLRHYSSVGFREARQPHPLFDPKWYTRKLPELRESDADPLAHFLESSPKSVGDPHPLFDSQWYLANNPDVAASGMNPLVHFLRYGDAENRNPHPLFDIVWYRSQPGARLAAGENSLLHFMNARADASSPHPLFDPRWYADQVGNSILQHDVDPLTHYITLGSTVPISPHPLFDSQRYLHENTDVLAAQIDPLTHYVNYGGREGRSPHFLFDTAWYVSQRPKGLGPEQPPLVHYLTSDPSCRCDPNIAFDDSWYCKQYAEVRDYQLAPLAHYVAVGAAEGRWPNPDFDTAWYSKQYGVEGGPLEPLIHFIVAGAPTNVTTRPVVANHRVAVAFLAWSADGSAKGLDPFAQSYASMKAGVNHDLVVIRKGAAGRRGARRALKHLFGDSNPQFIDVNDDGQDIHAYLKAAKVLPHEFVCFCNNYTSVNGEGWLQKLLAPFDDPNIGATGATASYESISDTVSMISKVVWLASRNELAPDPELIDLFSEQLAANVPEWLERAKSGVVEIKEVDVTLDREVEFARYWLDVTGPSGSLAGFDQFKRFPNPHLRSNAFVIRRSVLLELGFELQGNSKLPCSLFESGPFGLRARLLDRGLKSVLVGADGRAYEVADWPESQTFRLGEQENVLLRDNRVNEVDTFTPNVRKFQSMVSWGDYVNPTPTAVKQLGFKFSRSTSQLSPAPRPAPLRKPCVIGIALPSHNGANLVRDALRTLIWQDYEHWTCTVFDNASSENLGQIVAEFNDSRIVFARSEKFLPVTDSWNEAIDKTGGDYVVLIGDDDGFPPKAFTRLVNVIDEFRTPEVIFSSLWQFMHPGVHPTELSGYVSKMKYSFFFGSRQEPFLLDTKLAHLAVVGSLNLRRNCTFNMQGFFFHRNFLDRVRGIDGRIFQSPFPDYHLANVALALARDFVVVPEPLGLQGVSRKSFGFTLMNNQPSRGDALLNTDLQHDRWFEKFNQYRLWGPSYDAKFALTMEHVAHAVNDVIPIEVNIGRYRNLQIYKALGEIPGLVLGGAKQSTYVEHVEGYLTASERAWAEGLKTLGRRYASGDNTASPPLDRVAAALSMYSHPSLCVQTDVLWRAEFDGLPAVFRALEGL